MREKESIEKFNTNQVIMSGRHHNCKCCGPLRGKKKSLGNNVGISHAVESKYIIIGQRDKSVILMLGIQVPTVRQVFQKNL